MNLNGDPIRYPLISKRYKVLKHGPLSLASANILSGGDGFFRKGDVMDHMTCLICDGVPFNGPDGYEIGRWDNRMSDIESTSTTKDDMYYAWVDPDLWDYDPHLVLYTKEEFMTGSGLVRVVPGPIFSVSSFMGATALKENGILQQIVGAIIAATGIFLPSFLIVLFFFPIWQHLKQYAIIFRSLEGIYASIVGIMLGATLYLSNDIAIDLAQKPITNTLVYLAVGITTFYLLFRQKLAPQWIALSCLLLGYLIKTWIILF